MGQHLRLVDELRYLGVEVLEPLHLHQGIWSLRQAGQFQLDLSEAGFLLFQFLESGHAAGS